MGVKISELQEKTLTNNTDVLPIVDVTGGTKKITVPNLLKTSTESISNLNGKITNLTTYSTEEIKTGETWIDGKPVYRKVFQITNASGTTTEFDLSSLNISTMFFNLSKSYYKWSQHTRIFPIISVNVEAGTTSSTDVAKNQCGVFYDYSNKKMTLEFGYNRRVYDAVVTIEYTKTTD